MEKKSKSSLNNTAVSYTAGGNYQKASEIFEAVLAEDPVNLPILYNYGYNFLAWGKKEKAFEVFDRIAAASSACTGKSDSAMPDNNVTEQKKKGTATGADVVSLVTDCGTACYDRGLYKDAEKYYSEALRLSPENSTLLNHMGVLCFVRGMYKEAEAIFKNAVKCNENNVDSWFNLADTCEMLGKTDECEYARKKYLELENKL